MNLDQCQESHPLVHTYRAEHCEPITAELLELQRTLLAPVVKDDTVVVLPPTRADYAGLREQKRKGENIDMPAIMETRKQDAVNRARLRPPPKEVKQQPTPKTVGKRQMSVPDTHHTHTPMHQHQHQAPAQPPQHFAFNQQYNPAAFAQVCNVA
jgi:hypothetical protein